MRIGALRDRITIQALTSSRDVDGNTVEVWANFAEVWADVAPLSAREFAAGQALQSAVTARITIRYLAGVKASMRILHGAKIYNIQGALADAGSGLEYLTLPCSEGANDG